MDDEAQHQITIKAGNQKAIKSNSLSLFFVIIFFQNSIPSFSKNCPILKLQLNDCTCPTKT